MNKKILIPIVVIIIIIISIIVGYLNSTKPSIDMVDKSDGIEKCDDGTIYKECSINKPFYCAKDLNLEERCGKCGCSEEEVCQKDGKCVKDRDGQKTCLKQNGNICTTEQTCSGSWIKSSDSERCCDGECEVSLTPPPPQPVLQQLPLGISNPYDQKDLTAKAALPGILKDLGLSKDKNGVAGFIVDEIARKHTEVACDNITCQKYDFSLAKDLIDLVVGQGKVNLWVVLGAPSSYKFTDGKLREDGKTYLPDGPISRRAYKDYLTDLVNFVNSYGKKVSGDSNWHVVSWNLYNEVNSEYKDTFNNDIDKATTAYANFVIDSSEILRKLSSQSEIVLAGAGSGTDLQGNHGEFYKQVLSKIKQSAPDYEPFDYWESHWFGEFNNYKTNEKGYGVKDFIKFLQDNGYSDKEFVIRAGGTYSGQDLQERKGLMNNYQSERDQAEFLVKRFIYNLANGVEKIPWSTVYERDKYQGERHVHFQYVSLIYDGYPDGVSKNQECVEGWQPCPDPGMGIKKLSYYTFKHLIEKLKGSDWNNIQKIQESGGIYTYKFLKDGKSIWVAWNDNSAEKQITIFGIGSGSVKITEAIPKYESGKDVTDYNIAFNTETKSVQNGKITITLGDKPVFVEEK